MSPCGRVTRWAGPGGPRPLGDTLTDFSLQTQSLTSKQSHRALELRHCCGTSCNSDGEQNVPLSLRRPYLHSLPENLTKSLLLVTKERSSVFKPSGFYFVDCSKPHQCDSRDSFLIWLHSRGTGGANAWPKMTKKNPHTFCDDTHKSCLNKELH